MQSKLTLRLDDELIKRAKDYSHESGKSLSQLVAEYFSLLTEDKKQEYNASNPVTRSLRGILSGTEISEEDYHTYLEEKHS